MNLLIKCSLLAGAQMKTSLDIARSPTCEQEERPSGHGDAALGGGVVVSNLGALHAHNADDDADKSKQHGHHHEGAARLDVDWKREKVVVEVEGADRTERSVIQDMTDGDGKI